MGNRYLTDNEESRYAMYLNLEEKSLLTIEKYLRDIRAFIKYLNGQEVDKEIVIKYKQNLLTCGYSLNSINSMIASINHFLEYKGWNDCKVKSIRTQKQIFCSEERELTKTEYERLVAAASNRNNKRLSLILQTICGTGIRISELKFITVEAVRRGQAYVNCKSKTRTVFIVKELRKKLLSYAKCQGINEGAVFVTKSGKPMDRTNIWKEMKKLCIEAKVSPNKVFPHNLRHLFARTFYKIEKDIAKLADILGHSSIETTRIYIISSGNEHQKCMESMKLIM